MRQYQNETGELRCKERGSKSEVNRSRRTSILIPRASCLAPRALAPRAFTLTELLVVITIIAILTGLITAAAVNALRTAKQTRITLEIQQLSNAIEDFKNDVGAYPPNGMSTTGNNFAGNPIYPIVQGDFQRMFKKAFPRSQEPPMLIQKLIGDTTVGGTADQGGYLAGGMTSAEAIVFWLNGFSKDPKYPISGPGGPSFSDAQGNNNGSLDPGDDRLEDKNRRYEFDLGRMAPRNDDGTFNSNPGFGRFIEYQDPKTGVVRRINFWLYTPAGSQLPLAYVDASRHKPVEYDADISGGAGANIFAVKKLRAGVSSSSNYTFADIEFANTGKFQILHAGLDDIWGDSFAFFGLFNANNMPGNVLKFPEGPFIGDIADTLSNFTTGTLEDGQQ